MIKKFKKIYIEITNICNLKCPFCLPLKRKTKFMTIEEFKHVIKNVKDYTDYVYLHLKGEPLIHPNLKDILDECYKNNIKVNITTNGTLIKNNFNILIEAKSIRQINISLHALSEISVNEQKEYLNNVIQLIKIVKENKNFYLSLRFWLGNNQLKKDIINYLEKILNVTISENQQQLFENVFISYSEEFTWPENDTQKSTFVKCHGIKDHIGILSDGTVVPCCLDGNGEINLGNIFQNSLDKILSSSRYQKMLKAFETRNMEEDLCLRCSFKNKFA